jgi:hypothetical protein
MNIPKKRENVNALIANGTRRKRALEIVGMTELEYTKTSQKVHKYDKKKYEQTHPIRGVEPWRCPSCRKLIEIAECIYCRDRRTMRWRKYDAKGN